MISEEYDKLFNMVSEEYEKISSEIFESLDNAIGPIIKTTNKEIKTSFGVKSIFLWTATPICGVLPPFRHIMIIIVLIIYGVCNFILDRKLYLPCWGCQDGNIVFKCMSGTGKGSIGCKYILNF